MRTTIFLHSSKVSNYEKADVLGLTGEAARMFAFACCEVEVELEVNMETGEAEIMRVDGHAIYK